jgi:hypothetical protein
MAKMRRIKPAVDQIKKAGSIEEQAAALRAVIDHPKLVDARRLAGIESSADNSAAMYLCGQSARMIGRARSNENVACGCGACKAQLGRPWLPRVDRRKQPRYAVNKECDLWESYEGANNWRISQLVAQTVEDEMGAREGNKSILNAMEVRIASMIKDGEIGAVATTDENAMGYYIVEWMSDPYSLQEDTEGMAGVMDAGTMVADAIFYNRVGGAPYWYTRSRMKTVIEIKYVVQTGFEMDGISGDNPLPRTCSKKEASRHDARKVSILDHEEIMDEIERRDRLEYDDEYDDEESDDYESSESDSE